MIPENAKPVFQAVFDGLRESRDLDSVTVLDLGCSYGINAALLKYGLSMSDLYDHYQALNSDKVARNRLLERDAALLRKQSKINGMRNGVKFVGVDAAPEAIAYATEAGWLDAGVAANLEKAPPPPAAVAKMAAGDIIISTGCVGYVTEKTFEHLLDAIDGDTPPWVASFVLRMFPYEPICATLGKRGLATEKLAGCSFVQRRFASKEEQEHVIEQLDEMNVDPAGKEAEGYYHAEFYLSRPQDEVESLPLEKIVSAVSYEHASR